MKLLSLSAKCIFILSISLITVPFSEPQIPFVPVVVWSRQRNRNGHSSNSSFEMIRLATKPTKWHVRPAKTQISLGIRPVWSESSLCAQWVAKDPSFLHADSEDSDQTGRMPRLIWVFAGSICHFISFVMRQLKWLLAMTASSKFWGICIIKVVR